MPKYAVNFRTYAFASILVEADDEIEADRQTEDAEMPSICAQCSGWAQDWNLELSDEWELQEVVKLDD